MTALRLGSSVALAGCVVAGALVGGPAIAAIPEEGPLWTEVRRPADPGPPNMQTFARLARAINPAVVNIQTLQGERVGAGRRGGHARGLGTGFIIHKRGYVLTNHHVVDGADEIKVRLADDRLLRAKVIGSDERTDVALLKVDIADDLPVAPLGDSEKVEIGEWVIAIGNPFGLDHTVTAGIVSGKGRRDVRPGGSTAGFFDFIQTDASINAGNSGGPLINGHGEVIGINTAMNAQAQGIAFAIPINMVKTIAPLLRAEGRVPRSWLGLTSQPVTASLAQAFSLADLRGALVSDVAVNSPAEVAGILPGDVVLEFDGHAIRRADDLDWLITTAGAGRMVPVVLRRGSAVRRIEASLAPDPAETVRPPHREEVTHQSPLGMSVSEVAPSGHRDARGVVVVQVEPGSPASEAGLERDDVLLRVGERVIGELEDYAKAVRAVPKGGVVKLLVRREGRTLWAAFEKRCDAKCQGAEGRGEDDAAMQHK